MFGASVGKMDEETEMVDEKGGKIEASPWGEPRHQDPSTRVVGWRGGVALTTSHVKAILKREKPARHDYSGLKKALAKGVKPKAVVDKLIGLPPRWQVFYSTMPHLDGQKAFKHAESNRKRRETAALQDADGEKLADGTEDQETLERDTAELEEKVRKRKLSLSDWERASEEWDRKLLRARTLDRDEDLITQKIVRKLGVHSYGYGVLEGKLRSSDIYFHYLKDDSNKMNGVKSSSLKRAAALMHKQIDVLKKDVRDLLKSAAEERRAEDGSQMSETGLQVTGQGTGQSSEGYRQSTGQSTEGRSFTGTGRSFTGTGQSFTGQSFTGGEFTGRQQTTATIRQPTEDVAGEEEALFGPASASSAEENEQKPKT